jgi:hypothetical protein
VSTTALGLFGVDSAGVPNAFNGGMVSYIIYQARQRVPEPNPHAWYQALMNVAVEHLGLQNGWKLPESFPPGICEVLLAAHSDHLRSLECNEICDATDKRLEKIIDRSQALVKRGWEDEGSMLALALEEKADREIRRAYKNQQQTS